MSDNPYQTPPNFGSPQFGNEPSPPDVLGKVKAPAIALMVVGGLNILLALWGVVSSALFMAGLNPLATQQQEQFDQAVRDAPPNMENFFSTMQTVTTLMQGPIGLVLNLIIVGVGVMIVMGGVKMSRLQSYGFVMTATVFAMLPCVSNCCWLGLPIGIWAIIVLNDSNVKAAFQQKIAA